MKSAMVFIDGMNLLHDWRRVPTVLKQSFDVEAYIRLLQSKFPNLEIKRTYYFATATENNATILKGINNIPYCEVKTGRLQTKTIYLERELPNCRGCEKFQKTIYIKADKGTDVNIAVEMLKHAYNNGYDVAILVSCDADFASVVRMVKDMGKIVELVLFDVTKSTAKELSENVDNIVTISNEECVKCVRSEPGDGTSDADSGEVYDVVVDAESVDFFDAESSGSFDEEVD